MTESRWANVYADVEDGREFGRFFRTRADADLAARNPSRKRLYVIRFDLDDEGDRDEVTREAV